MAQKTAKQHLEDWRTFAAKELRAGRDLKEAAKRYQALKNRGGRVSRKKEEATESRTERRKEVRTGKDEGKRTGRKSAAKIMQKHPGGTSTIKRATRKRTATIVEHEKGARGGSTRYRFPMPDKAHARAALADLPKAKGLSAAEKAKIRARANRMLGK